MTRPLSVSAAPALFLFSALCAMSCADELDFAELSARRFSAPPLVDQSSIATNFSRRYHIPDASGGVWRLYFDYTLDHSEGDRIFGARARASFGPRVMPWGADVRGFEIPDSGCSGQFLYPWRRDVEVIPGMKFVDLTFDLFGKADFRVANVRFEPIPPDPMPVAVELPFGGYFDGSFHIGSGQVGFPVFSWRTSLADDTPSERFGCRVALPSGFSFVDASNASTSTVSVSRGVDGGSIVSYRVSSAPSFSRAGGTHFGLAVRADAPPGTGGVITVTAEIDGRAASPPATLRLVSSPPVKVVRRPSRYANAAYLGGGWSHFPSAGARALARTLHEAGATWLIPSVSSLTNNPALLPMWREEGMRRVTPDGSRFIANGFMAEGKAFCPCALYDPSSSVRARLKRLFKRSLAGCDGMWANWEPYGFSSGRRRLCARCAAAEKGLSSDALERLRSSEHARVVAAVAADVAAATDPSVGFIPGIYWPEIGPGHDTFRFTREIHACDYARELSFLNAFGPYVRWNASGRYVPENGRALAYFCVAREVMRQVEEDFPADARPNLMAFPLGLSGSDWASRPQWLELALESFFFNGWGCTAPWSFPAGGDARFLAAFARASALAAEWEEFVWNGARADSSVRVKVRGTVRTRPWIDRTYLSTVRDVPLVQSAAWEKGGERIVAVFNFDESNHAVCDVSVRYRVETVDVPPASCRVVLFERRK
jgi:hypothetical protein